MTRYALVVAAALILASPVAPSRAADNRAGVIPADAPLQMKDKKQEDACECCQKCKAAKSPIKSEQKEGEPVKDGCEDCCADCGEVLKPSPEETPPDIIEHKLPTVPKNKLGE